MSNPCVVAVYGSFDRAQEAIVALDNADFPHDQVSLATHTIPDNLDQREALQFGDKSQKDALRGAGMGGLLGFLLGTPLLMIPGIGLFLIAGPMATGMTGTIVGHILGSMVGWGVHEDHIANYEQQMREGKVLVIAIGDPQQVAAAQHVLEESQAEEVQLHAKNSADEPEVFDTLADPFVPREAQLKDQDTA